MDLFVFSFVKNQNSEQYNYLCMNDSRLRRRYYRLMTEQPHSRTYLSTQRTPEKLTQQIVRRGKYLYIDINEQTGIKTMEEVDSNDGEIETENIGKNVICSLQNSSPQNQKAVDYIHKTNDARKNREKIEILLKKKVQFLQSQQKRKEERKIRQYQRRKKKKKDSIGAYSMRFQTQEQAKKDQIEQKMREKAFKSLISQRNPKKKVVESVEEILLKKMYAENTEILHHGITANKLKEYLERKEMKKVNEKIREKEMELIRNFGLLGEDEIENRQKKLLIRNRKKKLHFPSINSAPRIQSKQY